MIISILGPVGSGKTTELYSRICKYELAKKKTIIFKSIKDIVTNCHNGVQKKGVVTKTLMSQIGSIEEFDVIGIDEGQFFQDLVEFAELCATKYEKIVIIAGLNGTFNRESYYPMTDIIAKSDNVLFLHGVCTICGRHDAAFSRRTSQCENTEVENLTCEYKAMCRKCFNSF